ncbi:MAG TPA: polysaccharide deacetylase, partial [Allosphingosinicella sp.]|nr:polysaccharide deacetylase [Allosphingosinicella sp.]
HGLKACFFVDPMPAVVYGLEPIRRMVDPILAAGQEVQLQLHPVWQSVAEGVAEGARFELTCFDAEDQLDLIETARDLLVEAGAPRPVAFRSGGYAADVRTLAALLEAGFRYDSSHNGSRHPDPSALPLAPDLAGPAELGGLIEVPVTEIGDAPEAALRNALRARDPLVTLAGDSSVPECRFERLCAFLASRAQALPTARFADLGPLTVRASGEAPPQLWRRSGRASEPAWPNALYRRSL